MKRIFAVLFMLMFLFIPSAFAAQPDISSDSQTFNPFTGVYDLKGHVHVDLGDRVIDGDAAQVYLYQLEVHAQGNISLTDKPTGIHFDCDSVEVKGNERTAYVNGSMVFTQDNLRITADNGSFILHYRAFCFICCFYAVFSGNVTVNGTPHAGDLTYNVRDKKFL